MSDRKPEEVDTIEKLEEEVDKVFLMADRGVVKTVCAVVIANRMDLDPVWLFLVAASSGGKTEMINAIEGLDFVHPIDTLTVNTFASGQRRADKETSLLLKINTGILTLKDFTSILEMNKDARREIMSQFRAIFDGKYVKRTGTGDDIKWNGKLGLVAAVTSIIHERAQEFSSMGERFIQYAIEQPDRKEVQRRIFANAHGMDKKRAHLQECFTYFINQALDKLDDVDIVLAEDVKEELIGIADYSTQARSGLEKDPRTGKIRFIPDPEMPTRVVSQLFTLASAFIAINKADPRRLMGDKREEDILTEKDRDIIYKIALDSIPRKRRQALAILAKYKNGATTAGVAIQLHYETEVIKETLYELNALGFVNRRRDGGTDRWTLIDKWAGVVREFEGIVAVDEVLEANDDAEDYSEVENPFDVNDDW